MSVIRSSEVEVLCEIVMKSYMEQSCDASAWPLKFYLAKGTRRARSAHFNRSCSTE